MKRILFIIFCLSCSACLQSEELSSFSLSYTPTTGKVILDWDAHDFFETRISAAAHVVNNHSVRDDFASMLESLTPAVRHVVGEERQEVISESVSCRESAPQIATCEIMLTKAAQEAISKNNDYLFKLNDKPKRVQFQGKDVSKSSIFTPTLNIKNALFLSETGEPADPDTNPETDDQKPDEEKKGSADSGGGACTLNPLTSRNSSLPAIIIAASALLIIRKRKYV